MAVSDSFSVSANTKQEPYVRFNVGRGRNLASYFSTQPMKEINGGCSEGWGAGIAQSI